MLIDEVASFSREQRRSREGAWKRREVKGIEGAE